MCTSFHTLGWCTTIFARWPLWLGFGNFDVGWNIRWNAAARWWRITAGWAATTWGTARIIITYLKMREQSQMNNRKLISYRFFFLFLPFFFLCLDFFSFFDFCLSVDFAALLSSRGVIVGLLILLHRITIGGSTTSLDGVELLDRRPRVETAISVDLHRGRGTVWSQQLDSDLWQSGWHLLFHIV